MPYCVRTCDPVVSGEKIKKRVLGLLVSVLAGKVEKMGDKQSGRAAHRHCRQPYVSTLGCSEQQLSTSRLVADAQAGAYLDTCIV